MKQYRKVCALLSAILIIVAVHPNAYAASSWKELYKQQLLSEGSVTDNYSVLLLDLNLDGAPELFTGYSVNFYSPIDRAITVSAGKIQELNFSGQGVNKDMFSVEGIRNLKLYRNKTTGQYVYIGYDFSDIGAGALKYCVLCEVNMSGTTINIKKIADKTEPNPYPYEIEDGSMYDDSSDRSYSFKDKTMSKEEYAEAEQKYFDQYDLIEQVCTYACAYLENSSNVPENFSLLGKIDIKSEFEFTCYYLSADAIDTFINCYLYGPVLGPFSVTPSSAPVYIDNKKVNFEAYNINGLTYFKLRDVAMALNGTDKQFEVEWNMWNNRGVITTTTNQAYTIEGGELLPFKNTSKTAKLSASTVYVDGNEVSLIAYDIDGSNYFKIRDLAKNLNFNVYWDGNTSSIQIDTSKPYQYQ